MKLKHRNMAIKIGSQILWRSCRSKKSFSKTEADLKANQYNQRSYKCSRCGNYHLTKNRGVSNET